MIRHFNLALLLWSGAALAVASCVPAPEGGGATGGTSGGMPGSGGASNTGGTAGSGGAIGSGGAAPSGGATGSGGVVASGGATGSGGSPGSGGASPGTGGNAAAGGRATSSGGATGAGGRGNNGGAVGSGGATGSGGAAGAGGASARFSFFVTSLGALRMLSGSQMGFGGDLRFGETGDGAGLRGADKICTTIAEMSMPGAGAKGWRAFLSAPTGGPAGGPVNAIERIGEGPWYDRLGRLFSANRANLLGFRPTDTDAQIRNDFPNESGTPNHVDGSPGCTGNACPDNHDTLTGSGADGRLYVATNSPNPTCNGWTSAVGAANNKPRVGHSWPRQGAAMCMGGGTQGCYGHWMSSLDEGGCAPGVNLMEQGGPMMGVYTVGTGGGYGGFYCFALVP